MFNLVYVYRSKASLSQEALARLVGVSRNSINSIENEKFSPRLDTAYKLANVLNVPVTILFPDPYKRK